MTSKKATHGDWSLIPIHVWMNALECAHPRGHTYTMAEENYPHRDSEHPSPPDGKKQSTLGSVKLPRKI